MDFLSPQVLALVPVVIGLVEVIKRVGLNERYLPITAIILGVVGAVAIIGYSPETIVGGIVLGLSSVGLFSGVRATSGK
jgi:hypothetical protein